MDARKPTSNRSTARALITLGTSYMRISGLLCLSLIAAACGSGGGPSPSREALTPAHAAAIQDSVRTFLAAFAADVSAPPVGSKARDALAPFYSPDVVVSTDLAPDEPVLVRTIDSLIPPDELVALPRWIKSTRFEWGTMVITPLAPGVAMFTAKYAEIVTDTTGTATSLPGLQQGVVRHGADGWRFLAIQSSHPMAMHQRQAALMAKITSGK
jgi:hypothetical protein